MPTSPNWSSAWNPSIEPSRSSGAFPLEQKVAPYVWDISGSGSLDVYPLPLPSEWTRLPKHRLAGYELGPTPKEAEVVFEFDVPVRASGFSVVTVRYRIGRIQYRKSFDIAFTVCPPHDLQPCA